MRPTQNNLNLSRRDLLKGLGIGTAGVAGLAGCSGSAGDPSGTNGRAAGAAANPPAYVPYSEVAPDKPGTAEGVPPVFYNYPQPPVARDGYPLTGIEPWRALMQAVPPQVAPAQNTCYQNFAKATGSPFEIIFGTYADYLEKFQVTVASGDIPDFAMISPNSVQRLPQLLEKSFTDLTDVLGGDAVKKYPGLANITPPTWTIPSLNGRIWGIAQPRPPAGVVLTSRGDVLAKRGIDDPNPPLRDGDDFMDLLAQLTNREKNEFAMGADPHSWLMPMMLTMFDAPNGWTVEDGKFVSELVTEQYKDALNQAAKIIQAGYLHPNSFSEPGSNAQWFNGGVTALYYQNFVAWGANARTQPEWNVGNVELPKWEGGGLASIRKSVAGYSSYVAIKKSDDKRLEQLLQICDYIASPFGTQQCLDVNYGVDGYNYNADDNGNPLPIANGPGIVPVLYAGSNNFAVLFGAGDRDSVDAQHDYLTRLLPDGRDNASWGLYSETMVSKGAILNRQQQDVQREVMQGSKPMSAFEDFVAKWKTEVGDTIAAEYEEAASQ